MARNSTVTVPQLVKAAQAEAHALGARSIEAEHLLLAIAAEADTPAGQLLIGYGLSHDRLIELLHAEEARSLAFVGVDPSRYGITTRPKTSGRLPLATSSKRVISEVVRNANWQRSKLNVDELLRAIVSVPVGTVARLLAMAGVDRTDMAAHSDGSGS